MKLSVYGVVLALVYVCTVITAEEHRETVMRVVK